MEGRHNESVSNKQKGAASVSNRCNFRIKQGPKSVPTEITIMTKPLLRGDGLNRFQARFGHIKVKNLSKV